MAIVINGSGTVTGLAVGGLPDDTVDAGSLANSINSEITANTAKTGITSSQATAITAALPKAGGTITGALTANSSITLGTNAYFIGANTTNGFVFNSVGDAANLLLIKHDGRLGNPSVSKAHASFSGNGTPGFWGSNSYNISSLTDVGTGNYNANFANNMANTNYDAYCQVGDQITGHITGRATTFVQVAIRNNSLSIVDTDVIGINVFSEVVGV